MSKKKNLSIGLGYFKQGDDLSSCLEEASDASEAFSAHAEQMKAVSQHLEALAEAVKGQDVELHADVHYISLTCDEELAQKLVDAKLADFEEDWGEEEED